MGNTPSPKPPSKTQSWIDNKWRPMMAWLYMITCAFDFIIAPIGWGILQAITHNDIEQWKPLTLEGAGLYHIAMGAVLGIAAWSRGKEKLEWIKEERDDRSDRRESRDDCDRDENKWGRK